MSKPTHAANARTTAAPRPKKTLKELFEDRDRTRPGSRQEEEGAKKILESVFPDTNAD
jgi:hypothetical protein